MATCPEPYAQCSCGSGKKYKFCCRDKDRLAADQAARKAAPSLLSRRTVPNIRLGHHDDEDEEYDDDEPPVFLSPARREFEAKQHRGPGTKLVEFVQPLIDETDGSREEVETWMLIGNLCWNIALQGLDRDGEDQEIAKIVDMMRGKAEPGDREAFAGLLRQLLRRHREMFPEEHELAARNRDRR